MSDDELLAAAARGDGDAFAAFYRRHAALVLGYLRRRVAEPETAFDLAAETFAAALLSAGRYEANGPAVAWLLGIAQNKLLESLRRGRVEAAARRKLRLEPIVVEDTDLIAVEERAAAGSAQLAALLAELPEEQRRAVLARVVDERDYDEIAAELSCSEQVVRKRVSRGLRALRTRLEERT
ncbi:RNA polymerase sigma factor [Solirubrobacter phytolaccae]|uniref:RNA polymerase sigma factor n=1 Tax=Solirubrobacter phytolaccae TaxID=1404360 RepID=A0A9X3SD29_9ACTN|nr:RNA polymerase sigma factor [Solirubrobacter phytolaccae]MDA0183200.1 RNA polymerase sigma factor [Solirubrobacter phytolaccae]